MSIDSNVVCVVPIGVLIVHFDVLIVHSPNSSGSSTPTNSINDGNLDGHESDALGDTRSIQSQLLSSSKDEEYDSAQGNDIAPLQHQRVRNPSSVVQRISSLMAIRNNVTTKTNSLSSILNRFHFAFNVNDVHDYLLFLVIRTIYRATNTLNFINFGCQTVNQKNAMNVRKNFQHFDVNIIVVCVVKYSVRNAAIKLYLGKLSIVRVSQANHK